MESVHTYSCTYIHTYTQYTYKHTYIHTYSHTYTHTYIHTYIHTHEQVCPLLSVKKGIKKIVVGTIYYIHTWSSTFIHTHWNTCIHIETCPENSNKDMKNMCEWQSHILDTHSAYVPWCCDVLPWNSIYFSVHQHVCVWCASSNHWYFNKTEQLINVRKQMLRMIDSTPGHSLHAFTLMKIGLMQRWHGNSIACVCGKQTNVFVHGHDTEIRGLEGDLVRQESHQSRHAWHHALSPLQETLTHHPLYCMFLIDQGNSSSEKA